MYSQIAHLSARTSAKWLHLIEASKTNTEHFASDQSEKAPFNNAWLFNPNATFTYVIFSIMKKIEGWIALQPHDRYQKQAIITLTRFSSRYIKSPRELSMLNRNSIDRYFLRTVKDVAQSTTPKLQPHPLPTTMLIRRITYVHENPWQSPPSNHFVWIL